MPLFDLLLKATLENVLSIRVSETFNFRVKFSCDGCGDVSEKAQPFSWVDSVDVPGGKGSAKFLAKCKGCGRQYNVDITSTVGDFVYAAEHSGSWQRVATLECRGGVFPSSFEISDGYSIVGPTETWDDQDLGDDWAEFDEEGDASVSVLLVEARFEATGRGK